MRPASHQLQFAGPVLGQAPVNGISVGLQVTAKRFEKFFRRALAAGRLPIKEHIAPRSAVGPQITLLRPAGLIGIQIANGRLVGLQIAPGQEVLFHRQVDRFEPKSSLAHPFAQALPRDRNSVTLAIDFLLPIERQMILIFADEHLGHQTRPHITFVHQTRRQRRDHHLLLAFQFG